MITYKKETIQEIFKRAFSLKEDSASNEEIRQRLLNGRQVTGTNLCVLVCAMVIASVGLNTGSTAVIIGQTRKDKVTNIIPGVAIATALMPPLCTCGYSIANGDWRMLGGAAYLFVINTYFIFLSAALILSVMRIPKIQELTREEWKTLRFRMIRNTIIIIIPSILALYSIGC